MNYAAVTWTQVNGDVEGAILIADPNTAEWTIALSDQATSVSIRFFGSMDDARSHIISEMMDAHQWAPVAYDDEDDFEDSDPIFCEVDPACGGEVVGLAVDSTGYCAEHRDYAYEVLRTYQSVGELDGLNMFVVAPMDGWYIVSESAQSMCGPFKSEDEANSYLRDPKIYPITEDEFIAYRNQGAPYLVA